MIAHKFRPGDSVYYQEEVVTINLLTTLNGHPAYWVNELTERIPDFDCRVVPTYEEEEILNPDMV